jgi:membrane protease subunit (stomatin/prohibitin family)
MTLVTNDNELGMKEKINEHYQKMGWFSTSLAVGFLNCNDHLQLIVTWRIFMGMTIIKQVAWIAIDEIHHRWNCIRMQLLQFNYNYVGTIIVQFYYN